MPWDADIDDPVAVLAAARAEHGDTFVVGGDGTDYLFLFSPAGVRSFYELDEADASKGIADWQMLRRKLPDELFLGRRTFPHDLFARDDVVQYRAVVDGAVDLTWHELGSTGAVDVFDLTRRLGHRIGLSTWAGPCGAPRARLRPVGRRTRRARRCGRVRGSRRDDRRRCERQGGRVRRARRGRGDDRRRDRAPRRGPCHRRTTTSSASSTPGRTRPTARGGSRGDVVLVHLGSMSNLFAALGWLLVDVLARPELLDAVRAGDTELAERCAMESIRVAQRSIMMRAVVRPCVVADEEHEYSVDRGVTIATLLPLTNCPAGTDLAGYDPDRWSRRRLKADRVPAARELVTTFGHGAHTCPAQPFSLAVMVAALTSFVATFDAALTGPVSEPRRAQIGGIARPEQPCEITYRRH